MVIKTLDPDLDPDPEPDRYSVQNMPTDGIRNAGCGEYAGERILGGGRQGRVNALLLDAAQDSGQACRHQPSTVKDESETRDVINDDASMIGTQNEKINNKY